jgi:7-cyano-7-deazaguanine synthase
VAPSEHLLMVTGGLDSTVNAYWSVLREESRVHGVYFDLGRPASPRERASINRMSAALNIPVEIVGLQGLDASFLGHLPHSAIVAAELDFDPTAQRIIAATVRGGFASLLTLAAFYGHMIRTNRISLAIVEHQLAGVPQFTSFLKQLASSLETLQPGLPAIEFELPFSSMSKADVIRRGLDVEVPFEDTWSCVNYGEFHCGRCYPCQGRRQSFVDAGLEDPTTYEE